MSKVNKKRFELESSLIEAFNHQIQSHANPERIGCPGTSALRQLDLDPQGCRKDSILAHIGHCAACVRELGELHRRRLALHSSG